MLLLAAWAGAAPPGAAPARKGPKASLLIPEEVKRRRAAEADPEPLPLAALGSARLLEALGPLRPEPGAWVEYAVRQPGEAEVRVRLQQLGPLLSGGRFWLEIDAASPQALPLAARLLVRGLPVRAQDVERLQVYVPGQAVVELPVADAREQLPPEEAQRPTAELTRKAPAAVTVAAGRFHAAQLRLGRGSLQLTLWHSDEVPLLGLVRSVEGSRTVELFALGHSGARSLFPESDPLDLAEPPAAPAPPDPKAQGKGSESTK